MAGELFFDQFLISYHSNLSYLAVGIKENIYFLIFIQNPALRQTEKIFDIKRPEAYGNNELAGELFFDQFIISYQSYLSYLAVGIRENIYFLIFIQNPALRLTERIFDIKRPGAYGNKELAGELFFDQFLISYQSN